TPADGFDTTNPGVTISGTGLAGATIALSDGGPALPGAAVDASGNWSATVSLGYGPHSLRATASMNGQTGAPGNIVAGIVRPAAPTIVAPVGGFDTTSGIATIAGSGIPGATVALADSGIGSLSAGPATAGASGAWSVTATLGYGTHRLSATQTLGGQ